MRAKRATEGDPMSSKHLKVLAACAALVSLVAFMLLVTFSDQADPSAYGPSAGAPTVHKSASVR